MHIPDGYLSPATCAATYALALPVWYVALTRVKRLMHSQALPLLAVFSAFSFVVMMFNLPLPGGTSGHAVGMAIASIVLGPWAAVLSISIALLIQALFFGDGGITTFGANALNMAIVGTFVAHICYRLLAGQAPENARRRIFAAAVAGYVGINAAGLLAGIEFGIQPMLFHDANGIPLYAPYPLSVAIPAMLIGHLSFAGIAEMMVSAGVLAYLQRRHPEILRQASGQTAGAWRRTRQLWLGLAALMALSPLGLIAAGTAWGEWSAEDFNHPETRAEIAQASGYAAPPVHAPAGLSHLATLWQAPIPDYAPHFLHDPRLGYIVSAISGCGLILLVFLFAQQLLRPSHERRA